MESMKRGEVSCFHLFVVDVFPDQTMWGALGN